MPERGLRQDAFLLPVGDGARFCVRRVPHPGPARGTVVHAPAFAEEMNKSRHVVAAGARALAGAGYAVLAVDPLGCGDSPGDFGDATYATWVSDVVAAARHAHAAHGGPLWLWGLRAGALLATAALAQLPPSTSLLLWQPVLSGRTHLAQFLRLAVAGQVIDSQGERTGTRELRAALGRGEALEVAGYRLAPAVALGLDAAELALPAGFAGRVAWLEVGGGNALPPAAQARVDAWRSGGASVEAMAVEGPGFWQSVELEDGPALVAATVAALTREHASVHRAAVLP